MDKPLILIVAGDPSGDLHGSHLARALKSGGARVAAVGGPLLRGEADEFLEDLASHAIAGFWEPVAKVGFLMRVGLRLKRFLRDRRPEALVCIDYYGFNRRILSLAKDAGVPAYYFISPQVWASRAWRIHTLKRLVRRMLVIFPFEEGLYRGAGVPCTFVGHPLLDLIPAPGEKPALRPPLKIGILPGSRSSELQRHLPVFLEAFQRLQRSFPGAHASVFASPHLPDSAYAAAAGLAEIVRDHGYARRAALDLAISSSGTATLENALVGVPMVVVYKMSWPTYAVARALIRVSHISMVNLLAGRSLVPELIQHEATPQRVAQAAQALLANPDRYAALRQDLLSLRRVLGEPGASRRAAQEILSLARKGAQRMNTPARFLPYMRPHSRRFAWAVAAMCAVAAFNGGAVLLLKPIVDRIFIARDLRMLWLTVAAVPLLMVGKTAVSYLQNYLMSWIGQSVTQRIREDLFRHLLDVPPELPETGRAAEILSRVTNDLAIVQTELVSVPLYLIRDSMTLVVLTGSLFYLDWRFALIALAGTPATAIAFVVLSRKMRRYSLQSQAMMERLTERFENSLRGLLADLPRGSGSAVLGEFRAENAVFFGLMMRYLRATALAAPLMELCGSLAVAALLYFGGTAVIAGRMTPGAFFAFLGAFLSAYAPIKNLARTNSDLQRALASGERIFELLERERIPVGGGMTPLEKEPLIAQFTTYAPHVDTAILGKAYDFSIHAHADQERASGEHYFVHCQSVATSLVEWKMDLPTICAGLLHDTLEDTPVTQDIMRAEFGEEITRLVLGVTKLERLEYSSRDDVQAENWRKMLLATAQDIRVIVIKLADRLHNMQTLGYLSPERQQRIAHETLALYSPLAQRLGMFQLKSELEDLAFKHLWQKEFADLEAKVNAMLAAREATLRKFKESVEKALADSEIPHRILSRTKSLYSIYGKMQRQKKPFEEIQDALGVRIITDTISDCYALLGIVHTEFKPVAGSFTDYISIPKMNLYQSLHTTVMGPGGELVEIQIRTEEMHRTAEYGIAAHWRYKTGEHAKDAHLEEKLNWLRQWIEWLQDLKSPREFLDSLKTDLELNQVFVFTPAGEVKPLPAGATPLDFAFAVHTDIGYSCVGAQVNNKMVRLDYQLKSGDICKIITKRGSLPKKDWLMFVKTARARSKIRHYLREKGIVA